MKPCQACRPDPVTRAIALSISCALPLFLCIPWQAKLAKLGLFELASSAFIAELARGAVDVDELAAAFQQVGWIAPTGRLKVAPCYDCSCVRLSRAELVAWQSPT